VSPVCPRWTCSWTLAQDAVGAAGMAAFELADNDGRIIAANGEVAFTLGRRIDANAPRAMRVRTGERVQELQLAGSQTPFSVELVDLGLGLVVVARAEIGTELVGALVAYYPAGRAPRRPRRAT